MKEIDIESENTKIEKRIARLTWNSNGWVKPSGRKGKSKNKNTHEGKFGYGHEEWLFDMGKLIEGYHYGFLEPIRKQQQAHIGKTYDVWLYTIDNITKKRYWIAEIMYIEVIDNNQAQKVKDFYIKNKWHNEMQLQIIDCGANADGFSEWNGINLFNIRFKPSNIKFNSEYFELPKRNKIYGLSRYSFAYYHKDFSLNNDEKSFIFTPDEEKTENNDNVQIKTSIYNREPKAIEVNYIHQAISNALKEKLKSQYGSKNISTEQNSGYGNNKIDLVVKTKSAYVFYEIKSYNSTKASIREAIGQLLEYCFWKDNNNASKLIVISQKLGDLEDAKIYIKNLRSNLKFPIYLQTFDLSTKELSEEY